MKKTLLFLTLSGIASHFSACGIISDTATSNLNGAPDGSYCQNKIADPLSCGNAVVYKYTATVQKKYGEDRIDGCFYRNKDDAYNSVMDTCENGWGDAQCAPSSTWELTKRTVDFGSCNTTKPKKEGEIDPKDRTIEEVRKLDGFAIAETGLIVFINGKGHYCGFENPEHLRLVGRDPANVIKKGIHIWSKDLRVLTNDGSCKVALSEGFLSIKGQPEIYYSNGKDAYCHVSHPAYVTRSVDTYNVDFHKLTRFKRNGVCHMPIAKGFFKVKGQDEIYWSNGRDAYCYIPHPRYVGGSVYEFDDNIHEITWMRKDGTCPGMTP